MMNEIITCVTVVIVGVAVFILIHVCVIGRIFRRDDSGGSRNSDVVLQTRRMSSSDINKLPCFDYRMVEDGCVESCAVCLDNFKEGDNCRFLPICNHTFHGLCIDSWLSKTAACPICRAVPEILSEQSVSKSPSEVGAECITSD